MKKMMRKIVSAMLVMILVLSMTVTAFGWEQRTYYFAGYDENWNIYQKDGFSITASDSIEDAPESALDEFGQEMETLICKGDVTITVDTDESVSIDIYTADPDTYEPEELYAGEWFTECAGTQIPVHEPGTYFVQVGSKEWIERQMILVIEEASSGTSENGKAEIKSFSDIPTTHYAHDAIMEMVSLGMFKGATAPDANGVATFNASGQMKYVEFLAVMTRLIYPDVDADYSVFADEGWYMPFYYAALDMGLIFEGEVTKDQLLQPMTREQMSRVLVRTGMMIGTVSGTVGYTEFPDIYSVGDEYFDYVAMAYGEGLLCGVDNAGTFMPKGTLKRADAALVCYRLLDYGARMEINK